MMILALPGRPVSTSAPAWGAGFDEIDVDKALNAQLSDAGGQDIHMWGDLVGVASQLAGNTEKRAGSVPKKKFWRAGNE